MEENKQIPEEQGDLAELATSEEATCALQANENLDADATEEVTVQASPKQGPKKERKGAFFAVFGAVIGVCALLLLAVMFLGNGGFDIVRTLRTERTIFVRDGVAEVF